MIINNDTLGKQNVDLSGYAKLKYDSLGILGKGLGFKEFGLDNGGNYYLFFQPYSGATSGGTISGYRIPLYSSSVYNGESDLKIGTYTVSSPSITSITLNSSNKLIMNETMNLVYQTYSGYTSSHIARGCKALYIYITLILSTVTSTGLSEYPYITWYPVISGIQGITETSEKSVIYGSSIQSNRSLAFAYYLPLSPGEHGTRYMINNTQSYDFASNNFNATDSHYTNTTFQIYAKVNNATSITATVSKITADFYIVY